MEGTLTPAERAELASLTEELTAAEAVYLVPGEQRLRREREAIEAQNAALEALADRKSALVARLREVLAQSRTERQAIEGELAAVLAGAGTHGTER